VKLFTGIRRSIGESILRRKQKQVLRNRTFHSFKTAETCVILFDITDQESFTSLREFGKFLESEGIKTQMLGFVDSEIIPNQMLLWDNCRVICKKDLDWIFRPVEEKVKGLLSKEVDILFDLSLSAHFPLDYLSKLIRAQFKVGRYREDSSEADMTIHIEKDPRIAFFIEQVKYYVGMLNPAKI
jgi:hypothetical protein